MVYNTPLTGVVRVGGEGRGGWVGPYLSKQINSERFAGRVGEGWGVE